MTDVTSTIQMKLNGVWVDIPDVRDREGITARRGILGSAPYDRVAAVGVLSLSLDNSIHNSGGLEGYYSPDHANKRAYFTEGVQVRWKLVSGANTRYVWAGKITAILPEPGVYDGHGVEIDAEDYMASLLDIKLKGMDVQLAKRTDQIVTSLLTNIGVSPLNTAYDVTPDVFPYALDDEDDEQTAAMTVIQKCAQSDASLVYVRGNTTDGETLVIESRNTRATASGTAATLSDTMTGVSIKRGRETIINDVTVSIALRDVDTSPVVLWSQVGELELSPGAIYKMTARYTDPSSRAERVSRYPGSEVTPAALTDYRMSSIPNGSGSDLNAYLSITVTWGGNTAEIQLQNTGAKTGYINLLQLRAKGMYLYTRQDARLQDAASIAAYGRKSLSFNLPYQTNFNIASDIAASILSRYKSPVTFVTGVEFIANKSAALMAAALTCDIGSRIYVSESVTGIAGYYMIQSVEMYLEHGKLLRVVWGLVPAAGGNVWILGDAVYSVLGSTTIPNTYI